MKYADTSDEMVTLMRQGGGSQYDMVSASGDASLRLIYGKIVQPVNVKLIPDWKNFIPGLKSPSHNTSVTQIILLASPRASRFLNAWSRSDS